MDPPEYFKLLESNQQEHVEEAKKKFHEFFNTIKEPWLLSGLVDHYIATNSTRCAEILVCVREPHDMHFFNKMYDCLRNSPNTRLSVLTLLSHVVYRHPTWLYKISQHNIFKELLRILKTESDIVILMSALLILIVLLPMIPAYVGATLHEIFEVFSRLAAWNTNNPNKLDDEQLVHLQVSLHSLFHRLYGMYPCNFLSYLRQQYGARENLAIFSHTIKPMLETVKMHPLLVTTSKETETTTTRWKTMEHHDVVVECAKLSIDAKDDSVSPSVATFRARSESEIRRIMENSGYRDLKTTVNDTIDVKDLSALVLGPATTPPLPAPELSAPTSIPQTPIPQSYVVNASFPHQVGTSPPEAAIEATPETTPVKDPRLYTSSRAHPANSSVVRALNQLGGPKWSSSSTPSSSQPSSPMKKEISPFRFPEQSPDSRLIRSKMQSIMQDRLNVQAAKTDSVNGDSLECSQDDQEDQEVLEISQQGEMRISSNSVNNHAVVRHCDSVLQDFHPPHSEELEPCEQDSGSPCPAGGLHMANSQSIITFRKNVHRLRYYSQCGADLNLSFGIENKRDFKSRDFSEENLSMPTYVRRAHSCPEIKKERSSFTVPDGVDPELDETLEQEEGSVSTGTQTAADLPAPYPYEHMFLALFPPLPSELESRPQARDSPTTVLDKYLDLAAGRLHDDLIVKRNVTAIESELKTSRDLLTLLHLQLKFERHRRDIHAERNRRLLGKSRVNRCLEEHNSALRDQLALLEKDIESLRKEIGNNKEEYKIREKKWEEDVEYWQDKCTNLDKQNREIKADKERLVIQVRQSADTSSASAKNLQQVEAMLFSVGKELKEATAQATLGEALKVQVNYLHKELVIMGELQTRNREQLSRLALKSANHGHIYQDCYLEQVRSLTANLDSRTSSCEAYKARLDELTAALSRKDMIIADQKRALKAAKEECKEELEAVETKYKSQVATNRKLESHVLELTKNVEAGRRTRRNVSAAQDALSLAERGINSPLSLSFSSSEGLSISSTLTDSLLPARDLQSVVDAPEVVRIPEMAEFEDVPGPSQLD